MTRESIADRLVNYGDAVAAFSVVNSLGFLATASQPEVREWFASIRLETFLGQLLFGVVQALAVVVLRKVEIRARGAASSVTPDVERFLRGFFIVRLCIIATFTLLCVVVVSRL
jgi:hypothetical protein